MVWTTEPDVHSASWCKACDHLVGAFDALGLRLDLSLQKQVGLRIRSAGETECHQLGFSRFEAASTARAKHLLGAGHALTEFLIAPVYSRFSGHAAVCSLGALVNLMVVLCDTLLDAGAMVHDVLPSNELASCGGNGSEVMLLLGEYFTRLKLLTADERVMVTAREVTARMFEAEIETVRQKPALPFRFWLRKSCLPFVLMALPAWTRKPVNPGYLRWLYEIGRLFGVIDDAVDHIADATSGHPNYWRFIDRNVSDGAALHVAGRVRHILSFWDSLVPEAEETLVVRASLLYNVWRWLEPA